MFDGFMKAMKIDKFIEKHMPVPGSNRGYSAWEYIRPLSLMQYGGGRHIADLRELKEDRTLQRAMGFNVIPSDSAVGDWAATTIEKFNHYLRMLKRMEVIAALPY